MISGFAIGKVGISQPSGDLFVPGPDIISVSSLVVTPLFGTVLVTGFDITVFEHNFTPIPRKTIWSTK